MDKRIYELYEKYKAGIYRYILSITHDRQLSEDVLQDTFLQLLKNGICFEPGKEQAWLYKVARNKCFNLLKRQQRQTKIQAPLQVQTTPSWEYLEMIASLATTEQEIVTLKIVGGLSHREIARIIGLSVPATKKRYERAIQRLRKEMEGFL